MKIHVSVLFFLITLLLGAQNIAQLDYGGHLTFKPNTTVFLFGDNVNTRQIPRNIQTVQATNPLIT